MYSVASHPEAERELEEAALAYERKSPGLGDDFLDEFESTCGKTASDALPVSRPPLRAPAGIVCARGARPSILLSAEAAQDDRVLALPRAGRLR